VRASGQEPRLSSAEFLDRTGTIRSLSSASGTAGRTGQRGDRYRQIQVLAPRPSPAECPRTKGVIERFLGTLKYDRLDREGDGDALAVEINRYRHIYNTIRPHQALADRTPREVYLGTGARHEAEDGRG